MHLFSQRILLLHLPQDDNNSVPAGSKNNVIDFVFYFHPLTDEELHMRCAYLKTFEPECQDSSLHCDRIPSSGGSVL